MSCKSLNKAVLDDGIGEEMISIDVGKGKERQNFSVHKGLLQKVTKYFDKKLASEDGKKGLIVLKDNDPNVFKLFYDWLYTGNIPKAPTTISTKKQPSAAEAERLEADLRQRFNAQVQKLCQLYVLAEKYDIEPLLNTTIDKIQDAFHEYGTVFGPGLLVEIFKTTKKGSKLRELCIAANVLHIDRGCGQLREELMMACMMHHDFFPEMMKWISRNFVMFGRRQSEGFDVRKPTQGFSMLNRKKLCPCHFHKHTIAADAHKGHKKCAVPYIKCGHSDEDAEAADAMDTSGSDSIALNAIPEDLQRRLAAALIGNLQ